MMFTIEVTCERGHSQSYRIGGLTRAQAEAQCHILDGTSPFFISSPRDDPNCKLCRCNTCGTLFTAAIVHEESEES